MASIAEKRAAALGRRQLADVPAWALIRPSVDAALAEMVRDARHGPHLGPRPHRLEARADGDHQPAGLAAHRRGDDRTTWIAWTRWQTLCVAEDTPTRCCWGWAAPAWRRRSSARPLAAKEATWIWPCWTAPTRRRPGPRRTIGPGQDAVHRRRPSRAARWRRSPSSSTFTTGWPKRWAPTRPASTLSPSPTRAAAGGPGRQYRLPRDLSQRPEHRRALLGALLLWPGAGGAGGRGPGALHY